jgi:hypothetical protein
VIKKYYINWKDLPLHGRILATPGIVIFLLIMMILSPLILLMGIFVFTIEVFGGFDAEGPY